MVFTQDFRRNPFRLPPVFSARVLARIPRMRQFGFPQTTKITDSGNKLQRIGKQLRLLKGMQQLIIKHCLEENWIHVRQQQREL